MRGQLRAAMRLAAKDGHEVLIYCVVYISRSSDSPRSDIVIDCEQRRLFNSVYLACTGHLTSFFWSDIVIDCEQMRLFGRLVLRAVRITFLCTATKYGVEAAIVKVFEMPLVPLC